MPQWVHPLQEWFWGASILSQFLSMVALLAAAYKYARARDTESAETLRHLEERFQHFHAPWQFTSPTGSRQMPPITRAIEIDAAEFVSTSLASSIEKGIKRAQSSRDEIERAWIPRLDEFLRFLMIVSAMERHRLLKRRALWDAYHYWFRTVQNNALVRLYVQSYFPVLASFLARSARRLRKYEDLARGSAERAREEYERLKAQRAI